MHNALVQHAKFFREISMQVLRIQPPPCLTRFFAELILSGPRMQV